MFEVKKPKQKSMVVIRAATGAELSTYEKRKLANIEAGAQENKIEVIKINGQHLEVDPLNKEVNIDLSKFERTIHPTDISTEELFFIRCELDSNSVDCS
jgi:hypothetical protein